MSERDWKFGEDDVSEDQDNDNSTIKNALTGGAVVGGGLLLVVLIAAVVLGPLLTIAAWKFSYITFETAVVILLLFSIYLSGGS